MLVAAMSDNRAIRCSKRRCNWKGLENELKGILLADSPLKAEQRVCPACGHDSYYVMTPREIANWLREKAQPASGAILPLMFKMRIYWQCLPRDSDADYLFEDISFDTELPYIPQVGGSLSITPHQDIARIDDVVYIPYQDDEYERICVYLVTPDAVDDFATLAAEGWKSA